MNDSKIIMQDDRRHRIKGQYPTLYLELLDLFDCHDPVGLIAIGVPKHEYEPEVSTILPRLLDTSPPLSSGEIQRILYEEFVAWFGESTAGPAEIYQPIAEEIMFLLRNHLEFNRK